MTYRSGVFDIRLKVTAEDQHSKSSLSLQVEDERGNMTTFPLHELFTSEAEVKLLESEYHRYQAYITYVKAQLKERER